MAKAWRRRCEEPTSPSAATTRSASLLITCSCAARRSERPLARSASPLRLRSSIIIQSRSGRRRPSANTARRFVANSQAKAEAMDHNLRAWIGRSEETHDVAAEGPIRRLAALLDHDEPPWAPGVLPPLGHWLYFLPEARQSSLGPDGHPSRGGFLPPVALPRRRTDRLSPPDSVRRRDDAALDHHRHRRQERRVGADDLRHRPA